MSKTTFVMKKCSCKYDSTIEFEQKYEECWNRNFIWNTIILCFINVFESNHSKTIKTLTILKINLGLF